jgi:hypothetical protein
MVVPRYRGNMPKLIALVVVTVLVASACGSAGEDIAASADSDVSEPSSSVAATTTSSPTTVVDEVSSTTPEPIAVALPSGRDAIAAAEGSAHVLWFWGAH